MNSRRTLTAALMMSIVALLVGMLYAGHPEQMRLLGTISLPEVHGRIDHMATDPAAKRMFVAAFGNGSLEVGDLGSKKNINTIRSLKEPQGVLAIPEQNRLFVTNGGDGTLRIFDEESLAPIKTIHFPGDADNIRYDRLADLIYVGYGKGAIGIVDSRSLERIGDIPLPGHPESFQLETRSGRIFVNVPSAGKVVVIDRTKQSIIAEWRVPGSCSNFPMALDEDGKRLFIGCRHPAKVIVYDTGNGKQVSEFPIAGDADDLFFDAARKRIYASCGAGVLQIFDQTADGSYRPAGNIPTEAGARTSLFVPELSHLYLAVPRSARNAAQIRIYSIEP